MPTGGGRTGRVLVPVDEQERRDIEQAADAVVTELLVSNPDMPVRFDPPKHHPRRSPEPKYFYGSSQCRAIIRRKNYKTWGALAVLLLLGSSSKQKRVVIHEHPAFESTIRGSILDRAIRSLGVYVNTTDHHLY